VDRKIQRSRAPCGDTARCSPFPAAAEATHVARRSFVIRQIASLAARARARARVSQVRARRACTLPRAPRPFHFARAARARRIIIILTIRAGRVAAGG